MMWYKNTSVFSHEQLVLAEHSLKILNFAKYSINTISSSSADKYDIRPIRIIFQKIDIICRELERVIKTTYHIQGRRGSDFTSRPWKMFNNISDPFPPHDMSIYQFDPNIKKLCHELLKNLQSKQFFRLILGADASIDRFVPSLELELLQVSHGHEEEYIQKNNLTDSPIVILGKKCNRKKLGNAYYEENCTITIKGTHSKDVIDKFGKDYAENNKRGQGNSYGGYGENSEGNTDVFINYLIDSSD